MIITYQGDNYFKFQSGKKSILIDPTDQRSFKGADIILNTKKPAETERPTSKEKVFWIDHSGEYEIGGTRIYGWQSSSNEIEKTIYRIDFEGFRIIVFGFLETVPEEKFQEYLTDIDIVIAPVRKDGLVKLSDIAKFIRQIEPGIIIPSFTNDLKEFLDEFNAEENKKEDKLVLSKNDIKEGGMEVRCFK